MKLKHSFKESSKKIKNLFRSICARNIVESLMHKHCQNDQQRPLLHALCYFAGVSPIVSFSSAQFFASLDCSYFWPLTLPPAASPAAVMQSSTFFSQGIGVASDEFLLELCRAGSIGRDRHPFTKDVHQKP